MDVTVLETAVSSIFKAMNYRQKTKKRPTQPRGHLELFGYLRSYLHHVHYSSAPVCSVVCFHWWLLLRAASMAHPSHVTSPPWVLRCLTLHCGYQMKVIVQVKHIMKEFVNESFLWAGAVSQPIEYLLCMHEGLNFPPQGPCFGGGAMEWVGLAIQLSE